MTGLSGTRWGPLPPKKGSELQPPAPTWSMSSISEGAQHICGCSMRGWVLYGCRRKSSETKEPKCCSLVQRDCKNEKKPSTKEMRQECNFSQRLMVPHSIDWSILSGAGATSTETPTNVWPPPPVMGGHCSFNQAASPWQLPNCTLHRQDPRTVFSDINCGPPTGSVAVRLPDLRCLRSATHRPLFRDTCGETPVLVWGGGIVR